MQNDKNSLKNFLLDEIFQPLVDFLSDSKMTIDYSDEANIKKAFTEVICKACIGNADQYFESLQDILSITDNDDEDIINNYESDLKTIENLNLQVKDKQDEQDKIDNMIDELKSDTKISNLALISVEEEYESFINNSKVKEFNNKLKKKKKKVDKEDAQRQSVINDVLFFIDALNRRVKSHPYSKT